MLKSFVFALLLPTLAHPAEVLYEGTGTVQLFKTGVDQPGWWTVVDGLPDKFLGPNESGTILSIGKDGVSVLTQKKKHILQKSASPMPGSKPSMTPESCSKVDLAEKLGPVRNQTAGTCFAYTATEILNFDIPKQYSALHLATTFESKVAKPDDHVFKKVGGFSAGHVQEAIKKGMQYGLCPEEFVPSVPILKTEYVKLLEYYLKARQDQARYIEECKMEVSALEDKTILKMLAIYGKKLLDHDGWKNDEVLNEVKKTFPKVSSTRVIELFKESPDLDSFVKKLNAESCKNQLEKIPPGKTIEDVRSYGNLKQEGDDWIYYLEDQEVLLNHINETLTKGRPVGISYITGGLIKPLKTTEHAYHASVIAGRAWHEEEKDEKGNIVSPAGCRYLVKNSWGPDWKVPEGLKARSSSQYPGHFLMTEKDILEHVYGTAAID